MSYLICDIDGTIANLNHRLHYIDKFSNVKPNYDLFFDSCDKDEPIKEVIDILCRLWGDYEVIFLTGRAERSRKQTEEWLKKHIPVLEGYVGVQYKLFMRKDGDKRHDTEVKPEALLRGLGLSDLTQWPTLAKEVAFILEDRNSMVKKWRELGFTCFQVAEGDF